MTRQLSVFLCHAREDKPIVWELYNSLKSVDWIDPWLDKEKILPGQDWQAIIEQAVDEADVIIICLSNQSVQRDGYVHKEIRYAYDIALEKPDGSIYLIPLRLDDVTHIPRRLHAFHWMDYFGNQKQNEYSKLLQSLYKRYEQKLMQEEKPISFDDGNGTEQASRMESKKPVFKNRDLGDSTGVSEFRRGEPGTGKNRHFWLSKRRIKQIIVGVILLGFILGVSWFVPFAKNWLTPNMPTATITPAITKVPTNVAAKGSTVILTVTASPTLPLDDVTPTPPVGIDGMTMIYIPSGEFWFGNNHGDADEKPLQSMHLEGYWIDQTEVTNKMYAMCVAAGTCLPPSYVGSPSEKVYYGNPKYENFPVIYVNWDMAKTYCQWAGRDLPTELQWEKAARGTDGPLYPWGDKFDGRFLNFCDVNCPNPNKANTGYDDENVNLAPVGYYKNGASVYGVFDLAGNVWEWVNDIYDVYPNGVETASIHFGKGFHVIRGGSWIHNMYDVRSTNRWYFSVASDAFNNFTGFRCAKP